MAAHSKYSASSAYRWFNCPGSIALCEQVPEPITSEYAKEGTVAHTLAEELLLYPDRKIQDYVGKWCEIEGSKFNVTQEMADHVQAYVDYIMGLTEQLDEDDFGYRLYVEERFQLKQVSPELFGTNDACIVCYDRNENAYLLEVIDLKYGAGVDVGVENNKQLLYYALGAVLKYDIKPKHIRMHIFQPRSPSGNPIKVWEINYDTLVEFKVELKQKLYEAKEPGAPLHSGDHCRWCPAKAVCPALKKKTQELARMDFDDDAIVLPEPRVLTEEELGKVLESASLLKDWLNSVEYHAQLILESGSAVPGYKLVKKRANRKWIDEESTVNELNALGVKDKDMYSAPKLKSPAQMEKIKSVGKELVAKLCETPDTGKTIAPLSDKREAIPPSAISDFDD